VNRISFMPDAFFFNSPRELAFLFAAAAETCAAQSTDSSKTESARRILLRGIAANNTTRHAGAEKGEWFPLRADLKKLFGIAAERVPEGHNFFGMGLIAKEKLIPASREFRIALLKTKTPSSRRAARELFLS